MSQANIIGMMRIKNEERWIGRVLKSLVPLCERIYVFDDHSIDHTREIVMGFPQVTYLYSPFQGLDEARDKNWILNTICTNLPWAELNISSPHWVFCVDGDEELEAGGAERTRNELDPTALAYSLRILYLWDHEDMVRIDGVYGTFKRPSLFRIINPGFTFKSTPWGGNLHCSSIPQEYLHHSLDLSSALLHYGYLHKEDRLRKYQWYNTVDPNNHAEDEYRHMIQGDVPEIPATHRLKWAGPLRINHLDWVLSAR